MPESKEGTRAEGIIGAHGKRMTRDELERRFGELRPRGTGAAISVRVLPRAKKNELAGFMADGRVKVRLTAPPVEGAANRALVELLAQVLAVRAAAIEVVAGASGRDKIVSVVGLTPELVEARLRAAGNGRAPAQAKRPARAR